MTVLRKLGGKHKRSSTDVSRCSIWRCSRTLRFRSYIVVGICPTTAGIIGPKDTRMTYRDYAASKYKW